MLLAIMRKGQSRFSDKEFCGRNNPPANVKNHQMEQQKSNRPLKRPRRQASAATATTAPTYLGNEKFSSLLTCQSRFIVFTGSGISVSAGLPTFVDHLYQKAAKQCSLRHKKEDSGSKVFSFHFLESRPNDCFSFFYGLYKKVKKAVPTRTHYVLRTMEETKQLVRHYTLNIDNLAEATGMSRWSTTQNPSGITVELHGNLNELVCRQCHSVFKTDTIKITKSSIPRCPRDNCGGNLRFRVLLYDDKEAVLMNEGNPLEHLLPKDLEECSAIIWVGISFQQSASCHHFAKVWEAIQEKVVRKGKRKVPVFIVDPNPNQVLDNLSDGMQMQIDESSGLYFIKSESDVFFEQLSNSKARNAVVGEEESFK